MSEPQHHQPPKVVNITSLKQAMWIKSKLQAPKPSSTFTVNWTQIVTCRGTGKILSERSKEHQLSPIEIDKQFPNSQISYRRETSSRALSSELAPEDRRLIEAFSAPATADCIMAHLLRVSVHLPIKGTNKESSEDGDMQSTFLLSDFTTRLIYHKVTELQLFLALEDLITTEEFFPSYSKLHKKIFGKAETKEDKLRHDN